MARLSLSLGRQLAFPVGARLALALNARLNLSLGGLLLPGDRGADGAAGGTSDGTSDGSFVKPSKLSILGLDMVRGAT